MEPDDILTDQMKVSRPVFPVVLAMVTVYIISQTRDVIGQCIQPHINNMSVIEIHRDPPLEGGSGYTQILQSRKQEIVHHLVLTGNRLNEFRMGSDMLNQAVCIFAHLEEIRLFLGRLHLSSAVRTFPVHKL